MVAVTAEVVVKLVSLALSTRAAVVVELAMGRILVELADQA
jgi:hypothetical protein